MTMYGDPDYYPGTTDDDDDWGDYDSACSPDSAWENEDDDYTEIRHPEVTVQLTGQDGNGFGIVCKVKMALKRSGVSVEEQDEFFDEATSGDYDHLLQTCMKWVSVR